MKRRDFFKGLASVRKGLMAVPDSPKFETKLIYKTDINDPKLIGTYIGFMHGILVFK